MSLTILILFITIILLSLFFDFTNGFHDSSNIVSTIISTRALSPAKALMLAAVAEFIGAYFLGTAVAKMIGKGIVSPAAISEWRSLYVILATLIGAISWNLITWKFGIPSSSSHALIGGLIGSMVIAKGFGIINWKNVVTVFAVLITSPLIGAVSSALLTKVLAWSFRFAPPQANEFFKKSQIFSSLALALSHGTNDAQKTMGIVTLSVLIIGPERFPLWVTDYGRLHAGSGGFIVPNWVIVICSLAIALGIASGGWTIIKTLGRGIYKIKPMNGFAAQTGSALVIYLSAISGFPVSTTQIVTSSIMGSGAAERYKAVRWGIMGNILLTWFITIPCTAIISGTVYLIIKIFI